MESSVIFAQEQLENSCEHYCPSCESCGGRRHAIATVFPITVEIVGSPSDDLAFPKHGTKLDKWTRLEKRENALMRERKSQAATDAEHEAGPEGRRREAAIPISDLREPSNTEREHELTHLPPQPWCEQCVKGRGTENPHKRVTFERAESTVTVIALDFCFIKTSGIVPCVAADEGATCMVLPDVDARFMKAVPAAGKATWRLRVKTNGARHIKTHITAQIRLSFFRFVNWYCSVFHFLTLDAQIRTEQGQRMGQGFLVWTTRRRQRTHHCH